MESNRLGRKVVVLAFPGVKLLDVAGPCEVFAEANQVLERETGSRSHGYEVEVVSTAAGPIPTSSGVYLLAARGFDACREPLDTLLIAGGPGVHAAARLPELAEWLHAAAGQARRVGSVCTGAFLLAALGLLDGRRATTHWAWAERLAHEYAGVTVDPDAIYIRAGHVYTSAGVSAGMDLALALVEEDLGRTVALQVAQQLVLFLRRPGGQSQFSALLQLQAADREPLAALQAWIGEHLDADLSVEALAERAHMSPRHFSRVFREQVGLPPGRWVERLRVEVARRRLEETSVGVDQVARECGFGSADALRRSFARVLRVSPSAYRGRFCSSVNPEPCIPADGLSPINGTRPASDVKGTG